MQTFWGSWCCEASMRESFLIEPFRYRYTILFAAYNTESYEGECYVLAWDHSLKSCVEVHASHCSCFGLEGQWKPEPTAIDNLSIPSFLANEELAALRQKVDIAVTKWGMR